MDTSLLQGISTLASAALGALLAISFGVSHRQLCALISFAAGTLFATPFFHMIPEAWPNLAPLPIFLALGSGYLLFYVLSRYVVHVCPACSASHFDEHRKEKFKNVVMLLTIGLSIHSAMDGMALSMGKDLGTNADKSIFLTILIHKFPEGLALCALLLKAGYERLKALWMTVIYESSTLVGLLIGAYILKGAGSQHWIDLALLHIGGGFIYLSLHAVLNEAREHSPRLIIFFFAAGAGLIGALRLIGG